MSETANAAGRDFFADVRRLLTEWCRAHGDGHTAVAGSVLKNDCPACLASALTAAYEAGRADAAVADKCCGAGWGEPCRHEVKP